MADQSYEFSAKNVDAAIEDGLRQLGVSRDKVEIQVLDQGSRGILGIGASPARVRITVRPEPEPEPAPVQEEPAPVEEPPVEESVAPSMPQADVSAAAPVVEESALQAEEEVQEEEAAGAETADDEDESIAELATSLLLRMLELMGVDAQVERRMVQAQDGETPPIYLNIVGNELGMLIGRHGETLASIQYLVRLMVNQKVHHWANIVVDVDGYKERRAERLQQLALRMADQVIQTGRGVSLEPMPPNERRLIHIALRDHPHVYTESTGEDDRRKVQILPK